MVTLRTRDIMIFSGMNDKLFQKNYFLKDAKNTCKPNNHDLNCNWKKKWIKTTKFDFTAKYLY